jgi:dipeptidyl aminopeptidase/acylaminoacyl peptidase
LADVNTGGLTAIALPTPPRRVVAARFAPDGRNVYLVAQFDEFARLHRLEPATSQLTTITDNVPWDIESFAASADGRYLAFVANAAGVSRLSVIDQIARMELAPQGLPQGRIADLAFDAAGRRLALTAESATEPADAWVYEPANNTLVRWTHSELGPVDRAALVTPEFISFPGWDRSNGSTRALPAWVYRPRTRCSCASRAARTSSTGLASMHSRSLRSTCSATRSSRRTCAVRLGTVAASKCSAKACAARMRCATSDHFWCGSAYSATSTARASC